MLKPFDLEGRQGLLDTPQSSSYMNTSEMSNIMEKYIPHTNESFTRYSREDLLKTAVPPPTSKDSKNSLLSGAGKTMRQGLMEGGSKNKLTNEMMARGVGQNASLNTHMQTKNNILETLTKLSTNLSSQKDCKSAINSKEVTKLVSIGLILQERRHYQKAIELYDKALDLDPICERALVGKGFCFKNLGDNRSALRFYQEALRMNPRLWSAHNNRGVIFKECGMVNEAYEAYSIALYLSQNQLKEFAPDNCSREKDIAMRNFKLCKRNMAIVLTDFARSVMNRNPTEAVKHYKNALQYDHVDQAYFYLGVIHYELKMHKEAYQYYSQALKTQPNFVEALVNIGDIYALWEKPDLAIQQYERAVEIRPNFHTAHKRLAVAYTGAGKRARDAGNVREAIRLFKKALFHNPSSSNAWLNLGVSYSWQGDEEDAAIHYEQAVYHASLPKSAGESIEKNKIVCVQAYNNLGLLYKERGNIIRAIYYYEKALKVNPTSPETLVHLSVGYNMLGRYALAAEYCKRAFTVNENYAEAFNTIGFLLFKIGRVSEAIQSFTRCLSLDRTHQVSYHRKLRALNYSDLPSEQVVREHLEWGKSQADLKVIAPYSNSLVHNRVLRVGFVCSDFFTTAVHPFLSPLLSHWKLDTSTRIDIYCYSVSSGKQYLPRRQGLKKLATQWRDVTKLTTMELYKMVKTDEVDILIDLSGHNEDTRMDVFALKPAPIQVSWLSYPNTTGLDAIDYRITDPTTDPLDTKQGYSESLVRIDCHLCFSPVGEVPEVADPPCQTKACVTLASICDMSQINFEVIEAWTQILLENKEARLMVLSKPLFDRRINNEFLEHFVRRGIEMERLDLLGAPALNERLSLYKSIDVYLDTFPCNNPYSICEALLMGIPVVTMTKPNTASSNLGRTILSQVPIVSNLVASTRQQYVQFVLKLIKRSKNSQNQAPACALLRHSLRGALLSSRLCNAAQHAVDMRTILRKMWHQYVDSRHNAQSLKRENMFGGPQGPLPNSLPIKPSAPCFVLPSLPSTPAMRIPNIHNSIKASFKDAAKNQPPAPLPSPPPPIPSTARPVKMVKNMCAQPPTIDFDVPSVLSNSMKEDSFRGMDQRCQFPEEEIKEKSLKRPRINSEDVCSPRRRIPAPPRVLNCESPSVPDAADKSASSQPPMLSDSPSLKRRRWTKRRGQENSGRKN